MIQMILSFLGQMMISGRGFVCLMDRFEKYLLSMLVSCKAMQQVSLRDDNSGADIGKAINLFSDFKYVTHI
jgi:hypothetical protein